MYVPMDFLPVDASFESSCLGGERAVRLRQRQRHQQQRVSQSGLLFQLSVQDVAHALCQIGKRKVQ